MSTLRDLLQTPLVEQLGWVLVHSLWQGAALGLLLWFTLVLLRRASANSRYMAACVALGFLAAAPVATFVVLRPTLPAHESPAAPARIEPPPAPAVNLQPQAEVIAPAERERAASEPASREPAPRHFEPALPRMTSWVSAASPWLVAGWIIGVLGLSARLVVGWFEVQSMKRHRTSPVAAEWQQRLALLAKRLSVPKPVRLLESALARSPLVIGWLTPVILLPASLVTGLSAQQLEALLAHELAHIRRHDYLVNLLQSAIETVLFYHPIVWWIGRRIRDERENACDDLAIETCGDRLTYARALTAIEEMRGHAVQLAPAASGGALLLRIRRLLGLRAQRERFTSIWSAGLVAALIAVAAVATSLLLPVRAENAQPGAQTVTGSLVDHEGHTVAKARLTLATQTILTGEVVEIGQATSGADGRFKLELPRSDTLRQAVVWCEAPGLALTAAILWEPLTGPVKIVLGEPTTIDIRAIDESGAPLAGLPVQPNYFYMEPMRFLNPPPALAQRLAQKTDAQGVAHFTGLPREAHLTVKVDDARFASPSSSEQGMQLQGEHSAPRTLTLLPGATMRGTIRYADSGKPAAKIRVVAQGTVLGLQPGLATTDAEGRYEITQLRPGPYNVRPFLDDEPAKLWTARAREKVVVPRGGTVDSIDLELIPGAVVTGRITTGDTGAPLAMQGVLATGAREQSFGSITYHAVTDRDGRYTLRVPPGEQRLMFIGQPPPGYFRPEKFERQISLADGATEIVDFQLPRRPAGDTIMLRVVDADGTAAPGGDVILQASLFGAAFSEVQSDAAGRLYLDVDDASKPVRVRARYGRNATAEPVTITAGGEFTVQLAPNSLGRLRGKVVSPTGEPVAGAKLSPMDWVGTNGSGREALVTGKDGSFDIRNIWPGSTVTVQAEAVRWERQTTERLTLEAGENRELPPLVLQPATLAVGGQVLDQNRNPIAALGVSLRGERSAQQETTTDREGRFRFEGVADEKVRLFAGGDGEPSGNVETAAGNTEAEIFAVLPAPEENTQVATPPSPPPSVAVPDDFAKLPDTHKGKLVLELFEKGEFSRPETKEVARDLLAKQGRYCGLNGPGFTASAIALAQQQGWTEMIPLIEAIYQQPTSLNLYAAAFAYRRAVSKSPPAPAIAKAVETLLQAGWYQNTVTDDEVAASTRALTAHADKEAVLVATICAGCSSRGKGGTERGLNALVEVLQKLDPGLVRARLETLRLEVLFGEQAEVETLMQKLGFPLAAARAGAWGEAVDGVQASLRAEHLDWWKGEKPALRLSMRNRGLQSPYVAQQQEVVELELDGVWYRWSGPVDVLSGPLAPGGRFDDIAVVLNPGDWNSSEKNEALALTPATHTVRVSMPIEGKAGPAKRAISNAIKLNLIAIHEPLPPNGGQWSRPENGLLVAAAPSKPRFAVGDNVVVVFTFKNISDQPIDHLDAEDVNRTHYHQFTFADDNGNDIACEPAHEPPGDYKLVRTTIPPGGSIERIVPLGPWKLAGLGHPYTAIGAEARSFRVTAIYRTPVGEDLKDPKVWKGSISAPPIRIEIIPKGAQRIKSPPLSTDNSPAAVAAAEAQGAASAKADIAARKVAIVYYGKPWSQGKPLIDDETGLPVEIVAEAGCEVTRCFEAEARVYNEVVRKWHAGLAGNEKEPAISWGEPVNGLRAGLSYDSGAGPFKMGDRVRLQFTVENASSQPVTLSYYQSFGFADGLRLQDSAGRPFVLTIPAWDGPVKPAHATLKPGEKSALGAATFTIGAVKEPGNAPDVVFSNGPGKYQMTDVRRFSKQNAGDWEGELATGALNLTIAEAPAAPAPAPKPAPNPEGAALLEKAQSATDPEQKWQAIRQLGELAYQPAARFLVECLRDANADVRANAARALSTLENSNPNPIWAALEKETDGGAIQQMARALYKMGCWEAIPQLKKAAAHPDEQTRIWVLQAIGFLGDDGDVAFLAGYLDDKSNSIGSMAADAIQQITKADFGFPLPQGPVSLEVPIEKARGWWKANRARYELADNQAPVHVTAQLSGAAYKEALAADKSGTDRRRKADAQPDPGLMRGSLKPYTEGTLHFGHQQFYITKVLPEEPFQRELQRPFVTPAEFESETLGATITLTVNRRQGRVLFSGKCEIPRLEIQTPMKSSLEVVASSTLTRQARFTGVADLEKPVVIDLGEKAGASKLTLTFSATPPK